MARHIMMGLGPFDQVLALIAICLLLVKIWDIFVGFEDEDGGDDL